MYRRLLIATNLLAAYAGFHQYNPLCHAIAYANVTMAVICYIIGDK